MRKCLTVFLVTIILLPGFANADNGEKKYDFGLGVGLPYGRIGANGEYQVLENVGISLGIGSGRFDVAGALGANYYFNPSDNISYRLTVYYGVNFASIKCNAGCGEESFDVYALGGGIKINTLISTYFLSSQKNLTTE